uniref:AIG1-type G domain-containing protein n=1 Tax=Cannabis sativa TaxID=3483 RepID=A0A803PMV5_CANSA
MEPLKSPSSPDATTPTTTTMTPPSSFSTGSFSPFQYSDLVDASSPYNFDDNGEKGAGVVNMLSGGVRPIAKVKEESAVVLGVESLLEGGGVTPQKQKEEEDFVADNGVSNDDKEGDKVLVMEKSDHFDGEEVELEAEKLVKEYGGESGFRVSGDVEVEQGKIGDSGNDVKDSYVSLEEKLVEQVVPDENIVVGSVIGGVDDEVDTKGGKDGGIEADFEVDKGANDEEVFSGMPLDSDSNVNIVVEPDIVGSVEEVDTKNISGIEEEGALEAGVQKNSLVVEKGGGDDDEVQSADTVAPKSMPKDSELMEPVVGGVDEDTKNTSGKKEGVLEADSDVQNKSLVVEKGDNDEEVQSTDTVGPKSMLTDSEFNRNVSVEPVVVDEVDTKNVSGREEADSEVQQNNLVIENGVVSDLPKDEPLQQDEKLTNNTGSSIEEPTSIINREMMVEGENEDKHPPEEYGEIDSSGTDDENEDIVFGSSAKQFLEELERASGAGSHSGADSSHDHSQRIDGQIVTDSDEEVDTDDDEGGGKEMFDSAALAALLKAATGASSDGGNITITSSDGSRLFSVERPRRFRVLTSIGGRPPSYSYSFEPFLAIKLVAGGDSEKSLSEEEKQRLEKFQQLRVKYLRLVKRVGGSIEDSIARQVLYRLALVSGRQASQAFRLESAKAKALQLESEGNDDLDFSLNILVIGKTGVGKSATINSIFGEEKIPIHAFGPSTTSVKEIVGTVDGVKIRVFDTPGLKSAAMEQSANRNILSSVKNVTKKCPPDIVLYVDRLDTHSRDLNDMPMLRLITSVLGPSIWRSVIVTLTHAASSPPDGPSGTPLNYELFVAQRSQIVQQTIGQAVGDLRIMSPSLMNPISLAENHSSCRKNRDGVSGSQEALWLSFSFASPSILVVVAFGQCAHPKLSGDQGGEIGDSDIDLDDLSNSDGEEEDEYDQLPPFKPLRNFQIAKLSKEQKKAYMEEYDYRVKLLQKKQWREELKRMKEMKKRGGKCTGSWSPLLNSCKASDWTPWWDHDCGYDGVNLEQTLAIVNRFPGVVAVQVTKDKKEFNIHLDSSVAAKHGDNGSSMAGFDIQNIGKQLAYIVRGETKFKSFKKNKTTAGTSVTFLGENVSTGFKIENQTALGKRVVLVGSTGVVKSQSDSAYGANLEVRLREADFPIGQDQSSLGLSLVKWRGDLALGANLQSQFSLGRNYKVAVRAGLNNKLSGQISIRTSSSEQLQLALFAILPVVRSIYKLICPGPGSENYALY